MSKGAALIATALILTIVFSGCIGPDEPAPPGDSTAPSISLISPENNSFIRPGDIISFSISDSNLSSVLCSVDGEGYRDFHYPFEIGTQEWGEGDHRVDIYAEDSAGNNRTSFFIFHIDLTPPHISLLFPANNSAIESTAEIHLSIEDANLRGANYTLDGGGPRILTYPYIISVEWWSEGPHTIRVNANDMAWNRASEEYSFIIDNRPTDIVLISPDSRVIRPGVPIIFEIDEENLVNLTCTVNGNPVDFSDHTIRTDGWEDGTYFIEINASDLAGHIRSVSYVFDIDSVPPSINSSLANGSTLPMNATLDMMNYSFTHEVGQIRVIPDDPHLATVAYSINGAPFMELEEPYLIDIYGARGDTVAIEVRAEDLAGNAGYLNISIRPQYHLTIEMGQGISEISIPFILEDNYIRSVFESINNSYSKALTFTNGSWKSFNPAYPDKFNLDFLYVETYMGINLNINRSRANLTIEGPLSQTYVLHLRKGSNFVPYLSMNPMRLDRAFADVPWYRVQRWDWQKGEYADMRGNETLLPGHAYWVYTSEECIITYDF